MWIGSSGYRERTLISEYVSTFLNPLIYVEIRGRSFSSRGSIIILSPCLDRCSWLNYRNPVYLNY
jgi:hypothetical protein